MLTFFCHRRNILSKLVNPETKHYLISGDDPEAQSAHVVFTLHISVSCG